MHPGITSFFVPNEYNILTCDLGNANYTSLYVDNARCSWLLDTGASLSAISVNALPRNVPVYNDQIIINGIGGKSFSQGYVYLTLRTHDGITFEHKFYLFDKLPCRSDGILGQDFFSTFASITFNFENSILILKTSDTEHILKLFKRPEISTDFLNVPPRSESIHYIQLNRSISRDCVIFSKEIQENIFLASCIVTPIDNVIPIKILNLNNETVSLPFFQPNMDFLDNYSICSFDKCSSSSERTKTLLPLLKLDHLHSSERQTIESICSKYSDIFQLPGDKLTTTKVYEQSIILKDNVKPVYTKPYRIPNSLKSEVKKQISKMLSDNIIEETRSEWSSPILLVPKKSDHTDSKSWRLVVDYRKLNNVIQDDKFPLPNINEILDSLSGAIYFTHLDLSQSYYQVQLTPESRKITAFTTDCGQYQMRRLPMGLKLSPSAFSRIMTVAMSGLTYDKCFVYLDDLVIFGRNLETHNKNLLDVFERLRTVNLKLNPSKCQFLKTEILYLGHLVTKDGILPDPNKITVIENYPKPKNSDEVRRFVAFSNYYRKFIYNFAILTLPLNRLCRKNIPFEWTKECEQSFQLLKKALMSPPVLQYPDFSKENEFILQTDASSLAIGAVLCNKDLRPVAYASRPLNSAERNYPTIQKELLAVVWGIKYFRPYLFGKKFTIMTDHKPLVYLFSMKDPSSRLLKFRLTLEEYDYKILYVKGRDNAVADALSRLTVTSEELKEMNNKIMSVMTRAQRRREREKNEINSDCIVIPNVTTDKRPAQPRVVEILKIPSNSVEMILVKGDKLREMRKRKQIKEESECFCYDESNKTIYINTDFRLHFTRVEFVTKLSEFCKKINIDEICVIKNDDNELFIKDMIKEIKKRELWTGPRICVLRGVKRIYCDYKKRFIINDYHLLPTSGHSGVRRMVNNIKRRFYWPGIERDVKDFVSKCEKCQKMKYSRNIVEPLVITTTATSAFDKIFLDLVGPLDRDIDDNKYILTLQCDLSKFVEAYPLKNKESVSIAKALVNNFILRFGIPKTIVTDRGTEFTATTMTEVCNLLNIDKLHSTAYHHETIGSLENAHKHLGFFLRIQCDHHPDTWSQWLPFWCFTYNNTVHSSTKYTPFELVFGKQSELPCRISSRVEPLYNPDDYCLDLKYRLQVAHRDAQENLIKTKQCRKTNYDKNVNSVTYKQGDFLLVKNENRSKLDCLYNGPFKVIREEEPNVIILVNGKQETVHKNRTKPFVSFS